MTDNLLYHGTTVDALIRILGSDTLESGYDEALGEGVSFSEDVAIARGFASHNEIAFNDVMRDWYGLSLDPPAGRRGAVLVVERSSLGNLNKVDDLGKDFEREWRTTGPVEAIGGSLVRIEVDPAEVEWYAMIVERFLPVDGADLAEKCRFGIETFRALGDRVVALDGLGMRQEVRAAPAP